MEEQKDNVMRLVPKGGKSVISVRMERKCNRRGQVCIGMEGLLITRVFMFVSKTVTSGAACTPENHKEFFLASIFHDSEGKDVLIPVARCPYCGKKPNAGRTLLENQRIANLIDQKGGK